jgi:hypothetical protein
MQKMRKKTTTNLHLWNGNFWMSNSVLFWYFRISLRACVPGRYLCALWKRPVDGAFSRHARVRNSKRLRGPITRFSLRATPFWPGGTLRRTVTLVRAITGFYEYILIVNLFVCLIDCNRNFIKSHTKIVRKKIAKKIAKKNCEKKSQKKIAKKNCEKKYCFLQLYFPFSNKILSIVYF